MAWPSSLIWRAQLFLLRKALKNHWSDFTLPNASLRYWGLSSGFFAILKLKHLSNSFQWFRHLKLWWLFSPWKTAVFDLGLCRDPRSKRAQWQNWRDSKNLLQRNCSLNEGLLNQNKLFFASSVKISFEYKQTKFCRLEDKKLLMRSNLFGVQRFASMVDFSC